MMRSLTEKSPLARRHSGFRSPLHRAAMGIALLSFVALNLFLVLRIMADGDVTPARRSPAGGRSAPGPSLDQLSEALRREGQTRIGASSLSDDVLGSVTANERTDAVKPRETSTEATGSSSTGSSSTGSDSDGSSQGSTGGSDTGGDETGDGGPGGGGSTDGGDTGGGDTGGGGGGGGGS